MTISSLMNVPPKVIITLIGIPESIVQKQIPSPGLPKERNNSPAPFALAETVATWLSSLESLLLRVPSAVVMHAF